MNKTPVTAPAPKATGALPSELGGAHISLRFNAPTHDAALYVHNAAQGRHWFTTTEAQQPGIVKATKELLPEFVISRVHEYMFGVHKDIFRGVHQPAQYHQYTHDATIADWRNEFVGEVTYDIVGGYILRLFAFHSSTGSSASEADHVAGYTQLGRRIARNAHKHWWIQAVGSDTNRQLHSVPITNALTRELGATFVFQGREPDGGSHYEWKGGEATVPTNRWIDGAWVTGVRPVTASILQNVGRPLTLDHVAIGYTVRK